jgi:hypothetical protein
MTIEMASSKFLLVSSNVSLDIHFKPVGDHNPAMSAGSRSFLFTAISLIQMIQ